MDRDTIDKVKTLYSQGYSYRAIAREVGYSHTVVARHIKKKSSVQAEPTDKSFKKAKTFDDFKEKHDLLHIVETKAAEYLSGENWYEDSDFRDICGISQNLWRRIADSGRFQKYRVVKNNRINAWAPPALANKMRTILGINE